MALANQSEVFGVAFFHRREQRVAKAADLAAEFQGLLNQDETADGTDRLVQAVDDARNIDSRCCRLDQHTGIYRWVEQSERSNDTRDIHAMANLEQAVGDSVPIAKQLFVGRNRKVECAPDSKQRAGIRCAANRPRIWGREIEWKLPLQLHECIADRTETIFLELREALGLYRSSRGIR